MRVESHADALRWLYGRNQFSVKLGLEGPRRLLGALGNPERDGVYLHVAGTNGKGSVCANLAALLGALGVRRVGLYTSPHLVSFRERIRVDGAPVPAEWITAWLRRHQDLLEEINPTYFECVTVMAFTWFRERECEAVVLETGLGGRLDATNVVTPGVSVITSISLDHTSILGDTLEAIWGEKLGIVKPGVPLVVDEPRPELARLPEDAARAAGSVFVNLAERLALRQAQGPAGGWRLRGKFGEYMVPSDLRSEPHQIRNAALSLLALEAFLGREPPPAASWLPALGAARLPGRTQWLESETLLPVLLDGAHNPAGVRALCECLRARGGRPRFLFAVMRDKDFAGVYRPLRALSGDIVYLDLNRAFPRALTAAEMRAALPPEERDVPREVPIAWESLEPLLRPGSGADYVVVCGSLYLLGEIIPILLPRYRGLEEFHTLLAPPER